MRKFLRDVLSTLLFVVLADCLYGLCAKNDYTEKYAYITNQSNKIEILIMGNSIAEQGINAEVLGDSAWCFAIGGRALYYDAELLKHHLQAMPNLRIVLLALHYNLMTDILDDIDVFRWGKKQYIYNNYRFLHVPVYSFPDGWLYRSAILSEQMHRKNNDSVSCNRFGNVFFDVYYDGSKQSSNPPYQVNVENCIKYLKSMAQACKEQGVRFIVVTPPFPNTWLEGCTEENVKNLTMITDSVKQLFPLEYRNYLQDDLFRNDSLYCNWNHLNRYGATLFAQRVKEDFGL